MFKLKKLFACLIISTFMMLSCTNEQSNVKDTNKELTNNEIMPRSEDAVLGYFNHEGEYLPLSDDQVEYFLRKINALGENEIVVDITVLPEESFLSVKAIGDDTTTSIGSTLFYVGGNHFALTAPNGGTSTCTCTSTGCSAWGCNASSAPFPCSCTDCGSDTGTCTKTSTTTSAGYIADLY